MMSPRSRSKSRTSFSGTTSEDRLSCGAATFEPNIPLGTTSASIPIVSPPAAPRHWETAVERVEATAEPVETDEALAAEPEFQLDGRTRPVFRYLRLNREARRQRFLGPEVSQPDLLPSPPPAEKRHSSMRLSLALREPQFLDAAGVAFETVTVADVHESPSCRHNDTPEILHVVQHFARDPAWRRLTAGLLEQGGKICAVIGG